MMQARPFQQHLAEGLSLEARLHAELCRLHELCDGLQGAAVATNDGLALCTLGSLLADTTAATAAFLIDELNTHLGVLRVGSAREVAVWTDAGPWYMARINSLPYVIALFAGPAVPVAVLRHAGALAASRLAPTLAALTQT